MERRFLLGWSLAYVGMAAGTWLTVPFYSDPGQQVTASAWNSATSAAASLLVLTGPMPIIRDEQRLERLLARPPLPGQRCAVLAEAERLLKRAADSELSARSARSHIIGIFTTIGLGLVLGYALQRPDSAATNTTIGLVLNELMIASRPTVGIRGLESYRNGTLIAVTPPPFVVDLHLAPTRIADGYGVAVGSAF